MFSRPATVPFIRHCTNWSRKVDRGSGKPASSVGVPSTIRSRVSAAEQLEKETAQWQRLSSAITQVVGLKEAADRMRWVHWFYTVPLWLRSAFWRNRVEHDLDDEIRFHVEREIAENVARGLTAEEARKAALRTFGGIEQHKEECRDTRRVCFTWLGH